MAISSPPEPLVCACGRTAEVGIHWRSNRCAGCNYGIRLKRVKTFLAHRGPLPPWITDRGMTTVPPGVGLDTGLIYLDTPGAEK